jgi:hypothetical protein
MPKWDLQGKANPNLEAALLAWAWRAAETLQGKGWAWEDRVKQQALKMGPGRGVPVHHDKCHSKINSLCTFGNYNYHFGVIYLVDNMNMVICFIILKVHLKLL